MTAMEVLWSRAQIRKLTHGVCGSVDIEYILVPEFPHPVGIYLHGGNYDNGGIPGFCPGVFVDVNLFQGCETSLALRQLSISNCLIYSRYSASGLVTHISTYLLQPSCWYWLWCGISFEF